MNIAQFLGKHYVESNSKEFWKDWEALKIKYSSDDGSINFLIEQLVERRFSFNLIKDLFDLNPTNEHVLNNPNLFKWAAAFHSEKLIKFFHDKLNIKDDEGAINAAIINYRLDNLKVLGKLGINVFSEKHFSHAIQRSYQNSSTDIIEYYIDNLNKFKITEYSKKLLEENQNLINWAVTDGNLSTIDFALKNNKKLILDKLFLHACQMNQLKSVQHLLDNYHFDTQTNFSPISDDYLVKGYQLACLNSYIDITKYLLTNPQLENKITPKTDNSLAFRYGCATEDIDYIHYLLTSPDFSEHADIHANNDEALKFACSAGNFEVAKYLLASDELKDHADFTINNYQNFIVALESENSDLIEYLILNNHVQKTEDIINYLKKENMDDIISMFEIRDLNQSLEDALPTKTSKQSLKPKI